MFPKFFTVCIHAVNLSCFGLVFVESIKQPIRLLSRVPSRSSYINQALAYRCCWCCIRWRPYWRRCRFCCWPRDLVKHPRPYDDAGLLRRQSLIQQRCEIPPDSGS